MKFLVVFSRIFVGSLFIVSGLIKANDPLGFSYKLEEYFAESALNLPFLEPFALWLAVLVCIGEIVLGLAVLFGGKMRLASWSLLILTLFFGWLTMYTATCDPSGTYTAVINGEEVQRSVTCVTDCGCFGDAMKGSIGRSLTPWESFAKDMVLLVFIIPIFFFQKRIKLNTLADDKIYIPLSLVFTAFFSWIFTWWFPVLFLAIAWAGYFGLKKVLSGDKSEWALAGWATILSLGFSFWCYNHLPARDYRPYAIGKNIEEGMKSAEELGLQPPKFGYIYVMKNISSGEKKEMTDKEYIDGKWWENKEWEMLGDETKQLKLEDGYEPPIRDFYLSDVDGNDKTYSILSAERMLLVVAYDIKKTDKDIQTDLNALYEQCKASGIEMVCLTAASYSEVESFRHEHQNMFEYLTGDGIMLKTIVRSNPGLVYLKKGTIAGKWHYNDAPSFAEIEAL
ncbi:MAG: DoxX family protein [Flavobacteriales bacterium]|nr:DoxX family protein [Flavobacteriales bacterium]